MKTNQEIENAGGVAFRRVLRVNAPHFCAGATWELGPLGWRCIAKDTAPILRWMAGKDAYQVRTYLERKKWAYAWLRPFRVERHG